VTHSYLVDTHIFLWASLSSEKLSARAKKVMADNQSTLHISVASLWEISIKKGLGKIRLPVSLREFVDRSVAELGLSILNTTMSHVLEVEHLPRHHGDPFDRLLIAQSKLENYALISSDKQFDAYGVKRIW